MSRVQSSILRRWFINAFVISLCFLSAATAASSSDTVSTLSIPGSFSTNQKSFKVPINTNNILTMLERFELDTHVEVVLLGQFDSDSLEHVSDALEQMSRLGSAGSSMQFTHEKIIFHVSFAKQIETSLVDLLEQYHEDKIERLQSKVLGVLDAYHHKITATRTLFVTHLSEPFFAQTYVSPNGFALLDMYSGGHNGGDIKPIHAHHDSIPAPSFPLTSSIARNSRSTQYTKAYDLATDIYRSAEALLPMPLPNKDTYSINHVHDSPHASSSDNGNAVSNDNNKIPHKPVTPSTRVHLQLLTLCGHPLKQCQPDVISTSVLENLARESLSSSSTQSIAGLSITQSSSLLRISNSVPLMAAVLASYQRYSSNSQVRYFSPEELLKHLAHAPEVVEILRQTIKADTADIHGHVLPIVSILLPDDWKGLLAVKDVSFSRREGSKGRFCDRGLFDYGPNMTHFGATMSCHSFQLPAHEKKTSANGQRLSRLVKSDYHKPSRGDVNEDSDVHQSSHNSNIDSAIVLLRSSSEEPSSTLLPGLVRSMFSSPHLLVRVSERDRLTRDATYLSAELFNAILQVVWDYTPPHVYYSPASQQVVTDYMWFEALAWGMVGDSRNSQTSSSNGHFNVNNNNFNQQGHSGGDVNYNLHRTRNFRQDSLFSRLKLFQAVDELLIRVARATHLLESLGGLSATEYAAGDGVTGGRGAAGGLGRGGANVIRGGRGRKSSSLSKREVETTTDIYLPQLQSFFHQMHSIALAFSHADYAEALDLVREAESTTEQMEKALHNSEMRSSIKNAALFVGEDGTTGGGVTLTCKEKHNYMYNYDEEEEEEGTDSSQSSSWTQAVKRFLTRSMMDYAAIGTGALLGVGGMSAYLYKKSGGIAKKRFYRG